MFKCNTLPVSPSVSSPSSVIVTSKDEKKKKESGDSFVNVHLRLRLICQLLSVSCCCRLFIADHRNELYTHLALQALFI
jgi:hypothetical protein